MTEIMPFPENNYETVLLDRPFRSGIFSYSGQFSFGSESPLTAMH